jgi:CubicO group peptidase (beta-lactamase class C family)
MLVRTVIAITVLFFLPASSAQQLSPFPAETIKTIEQEVSASMSEHHPALSVAVVLNDKFVLSEAFGTPDLENFVPATNASVFRLGSVSKAITAVAVMQLVESGKLRFDEPISNCVSQYKPLWQRYRRSCRRCHRGVAGHIGESADSGGVREGGGGRG